MFIQVQTEPTIVLVNTNNITQIQQHVSVDGKSSYFSGHTSDGKMFTFDEKGYKNFKDYCRNTVLKDRRDV